jgi:hypothetical protein
METAVTYKKKLIFYIITLFFIYSCKPSSTIKTQDFSATSTDSDPNCKTNLFLATESIKKCRAKSTENLRINNLDVDSIPVDLLEKSVSINVAFVVAETNDNCSGFVKITVMNNKSQIVEELKAANNELIALKEYPKGVYKTEARACNKNGCSSVIKSLFLPYEKTICDNPSCKLEKKRIRARMLVKARVNKLAPKLKNLAKNANKRFAKNTPARLYLSERCPPEVEKISSEVKASFNKISSMAQESISAALKKFDEVSQVLEHSQTPTVNKELDKNKEKGRENTGSNPSNTNDEDSSSDEKSQAESKEDSASNKITNIMIGIAVGVITTGVWLVIHAQREKGLTRTALTGPAQNSANNIKESLLNNPKLFSEWWEKQNISTDFDDLSWNKKKEFSKEFLQNQIETSAEGKGSFEGKARTIEVVSRLLASDIDEKGKVSYLKSMINSPREGRKVDFELKAFQDNAKLLQVDFNTHTNPKLKNIDFKKKTGAAAVAIGGVAILAGLLTTGLAQDEHSIKTEEFLAEYENIISDYDDCSFISEEQLDDLIANGGTYSK